MHNSQTPLPASKNTVVAKIQSFNISRILSILLLITTTLIMLIPIFFLFTTSLKSLNELHRIPPTLIPEKFIFENYLKVFERVNFGRYYLNSAIIAFFSILGTLFSSSFAAFGFARYKVKEKKYIFMVLLSTLMLPYPAILIPQYILFANLGWQGTFYPLIVPCFFGSAYMIFLLRQFFTTLPNDLFDACKIDGCSEFRTWWSIALPLCRPALATVAIFTFIWTWNDYIGPVIYLDSIDNYTLPIGMASMMSSYRVIPWNVIMAASVYAILPILILFFIAQKYFVEGIVLTGLK